MASDKMMNGKTEKEWEKIHLPDDHYVRPGCDARVHVPQERQTRDELWHIIKDYQQEKGLEPFQSQDSLAFHALEVLRGTPYDDAFQKWTMVMLHNESERELLAGIPYNQRLLLLPQCLRKKGVCTATFDAMGLLCNSCGACHIDPFETEAQELGYSTLVSEGTAAVMSVVQTGQVAAFVGVSCLSTLEKVFPFMSGFKLAALAVPLMQDNCMRTDVDADWVREYMYLREDGAEDLPESIPSLKPQVLSVTE